MQICEPISRPSKPGPFLAGLYLNSQSIMLMKNAFIMTNQGHIAYRAETSSGEDGICIKQQSMQQWMLLPYYYTHIHTTDHVCFIPDLNFRVEVLYNKIITKCRHRRCYMCCYPNLQGWNDAAAAGIYSRE